MPRIDRKNRAGRPEWARRLLVAPAVVMATTVGIALTPAVAWADPPQALPENATAEDLRFQPAMDYDGDGCYPTPAIGPDGKTATGLKKGGADNGNCHDESDLDNTNAYSRAKCNNDWCAYMYTFYFEKDQAASGPGSNGHTHDWEHVVVWVNQDQVRFVAVSGHGGYEIHPAAEVPFEDTHAKVVYNKDGQFTHRFRTAGPDEQAENHKGTFQRPTLLSWDLLDPGIRSTLDQTDFGSAEMGIRDKNGKFATQLGKAKPAEVPFDPAA